MNEYKTKKTVKAVQFSRKNFDEVLRFLEAHKDAIEGCALAMLLQIEDDSYSGGYRFVDVQENDWITIHDNKKISCDNDESFQKTYQKIVEE